MTKKGHEKNYQKDKSKTSNANKKLTVKRRKKLIMKKNLKTGVKALKHQLISKSNQLTSIIFEISSSNSISNTNARKLKLYLLKSIQNILNDKRSKLKKFSEAEIETIFNTYDIDNDINFNYLKKLQKDNNKIYKELINHYKYSISYKNSMNLGCLSNDEINKEINTYINYTKLMGEKPIKEFESFSKLKFFNFLFEIINENDIRYIEKEKKFNCR